MATHWSSSALNRQYFGVILPLNIYPKTGFDFNKTKNSIFDRPNYHLLNSVSSKYLNHRNCRKYYVQLKQQFLLPTRKCARKDQMAFSTLKFYYKKKNQHVICKTTAIFLSVQCLNKNHQC